MLDMGSFGIAAMSSWVLQVASQLRCCQIPALMMTGMGSLEIAAVSS